MEATIGNQSTNKVVDSNPKTCNWKKILRKKIPIITWLPQYNQNFFLHDLLAGFTVALTEIPQSMAYAAIAGLPLQYGLYSSFMGGFMYAIFGSCKAINMGSTSLMALLIQSHVEALGVNGSIFLSFMGGILILLLGAVNLGVLIEFFSYPVMAGFTSAAALTIASSQMGNFLGIKGQSNGFLGSWQNVVENIDQTNKWDAILGSASLISLIVLKEISIFGKIDPRETLTKRNLFKKRTIFFVSIAKNAIIVILGMSLAYFLEQRGINCFKLTGHVEGGFPNFQVPPPFSDNFKSFTPIIKEMGVSILFIPLVAILETVAVAKVFSQGKTVDASQEMIALGVANILGSFVSSMPVTGSFTRTAVNNASGAKSNAAAVFTGLIILIALQFLTSAFYYIPKSTLAAVIMCAMFYLFDFEAFGLFWKNCKLDMVPFLTTLLSSLFISLEYGILIGIATNLIFVLYSVARPKLTTEKLKLSHCPREVFIVTPATTIQYPAAEHLKETLLKSDESLIILNGANVNSMDITVAKNLADLASKVSGRDQKLVFLNFQKRIEDICVGVNGDLAALFQVGELEDVIQADRPSEDIIPRDVVILSLSDIN